jgi:hypothetical protein
MEAQTTNLQRISAKSWLHPSPCAFALWLALHTCCRAMRFSSSLLSRLQWRKGPNRKESEDRETETFCGGCDSPVCVDVDQSLLLCLQQDCSLFPGLHLSLVQRGPSRSDKPVLKIITATGDGYAMPVEAFHIKRLSTATQVSISVRLHPLIRFTRYLEKKNGEICRKALDKSARFEMDYKVSRGR